MVSYILTVSHDLSVLTKMINGQSNILNLHKLLLRITVEWKKKIGVKKVRFFPRFRDCLRNYYFYDSNLSRICSAFKEKIIRCRSLL